MKNFRTNDYSSFSERSEVFFILHLFHKFIHKLILLHHSVDAILARLLIESLHPIGFDARIVNQERNRLGGMCAEFARCGMIGEHGDGHRFVPLLHGLVDRPYHPLVEVLDGELLQVEVAFMTGLDRKSTRLNSSHA